MIAGSVMIWLLAALAMLLAWGYFRRWTLTRPPVGTVNLGDVAFMLAGIIVVPYLYLGLPGWLVGALLALSTLSVLWFLIEPVTRSSLARWGFAVVPVVADVLLAWRAGTGSTAFLLVNDAVVLLIVVGVTNLWAQGGLRARDLAILAGAIAVYDLIATGLLPLTTEMIERLAGLPFLPVAAWPVGDERWVGIGLGDLLLAAVGPLVLRKAYGRTAGLLAMAVAAGAIAGVFLAAMADVLAGTFPTMIVLGPLMVLQWYLWAHRLGAERTTARYLSEDPLAGQA